MSAAEGRENEAEFSPDEAPESLEALIDNRIHKLQNRRFFLQQMQQVIRRAEARGRGAGHSDEDVSELDLVEKELEELQNQRQNLNEKHSSTTAAAQAALSPMAKMETPDGGVYTLPPLLPSGDVPPPPPEDLAPQSVPPEEAVTQPATPEPPAPQPEKQEPPEEEDDVTKQLEPDSLSSTEAFTRCPSCNKVILTQTKKFNGDSAWLMCCICSLLGGVLGLCLIPFCLDRTKSVRHQCPECQTTIHTYHPF